MYKSTMDYIKGPLCDVYQGSMGLFNKLGMELCESGPFKNLTTHSAS